MFIGSFNDFGKIEFNPEEVPEELAEVLTMYNKHYDSGMASIEKLEDLKKEPFKTAVEISVEVMKKTTEESEFFKPNYEYILESKLASAPKYNFETFELILPTAEVDPTIEGSVN